jgi:predicted RNA-binding Zn-ribbon protein involved in translation (DUF1610 family)
MTTETHALAAGDVIEGTLVETPSQMMHPPAVIPPTPPTLAVVPQVQAEDLVQRLEVIQTAADRAMKDGVDYGKVPGTDKPTLLKPGAEKLGVLFQLDVQIVNEKIWGPGEHLTVIAHATVFHAPTGARLGYGEGACSTREKKYGKRTAKRKCPTCGAEQINRSKYPPRENRSADPGWYCHAKFGGCGAQFDATDPAIVDQKQGEVENPNLADMWNTVLKMAEKRARVDAVLAVTGASAIFTQDVEDQPRDEPPPEPPAKPEPTLLADESVREVLAAISRAKMGTEWVRSQLVAAGAQHVPDGALTTGTIQRLTPEQAIEMVRVCDKAAEAKAAPQ